MSEFFSPDLGNLTATAILGWYAWHHRWQPRSWQDLPTEATALELAEPDCFTAIEALAYLEGHNSAALGRQDRRWAVAVPVVLTYQGEPRPGDVIFPRRIALSAAG